MEENVLASPKRLDIYLADLHPTCGSVQYGYRPVVIIQNDKGNETSATVIVIPITGKIKRSMQTHVILGTDTGLLRESTVLCEQIQTIDKSQLRRKVGAVSKAEDIKAIRRALCITLGYYL